MKQSVRQHSSAVRHSKLSRKNKHPGHVSTSTNIAVPSESTRPSDVHELTESVNDEGSVSDTADSMVSKETQDPETQAATEEHTVSKHCAHFWHNYSQVTVT